MVMSLFLGWLKNSYILKLFKINDLSVKYC